MDPLFNRLMQRPVAREHARRISRRGRSACASFSALAASPMLLAFGIIAAAFFIGSSPAHAQTVRTWNVTSGTWSSTDSWDGALVPTASETAYFSSAAVGSSNATVLLSTATTSIGGLSFNNSGSTTLRSGTSTRRTLSLGTGGITLASTAGPVTISASSTSLSLILNGTQTWTNDSANPLSVLGTNYDRGIDTAGSLGSTLTITGSGETIIGTGIAGAAGRVISLRKQGSGRLTLGGDNDTGISGGFTLDSGTVRISNIGSFGAGTTTINGGVLDATTSGRLGNVNAPSAWNGDFTYAGTGGIILYLGTGAVTLGGNRTVTVEAAGLDVGGRIGDGGNGYSLTKGGTGTLYLSGSNTYTGPTTISAGKLSIGYIYGNTTANLATSSTVSIASGAVLEFNRNDSISSGFVFPNRITGDGSVSLSYSNRLVLTNPSNDFSGGISVSNVLEFASPGALGTGTISLRTGATLRAGSSGTFSNFVNSMFYGTSFDTQSYSVTSSGTVGGGGAMNKLGSGTLTVVGNWGSPLIGFEGGLRISEAGTISSAGLATGTFTAGATFEYASSANSSVGPMAGLISVLKAGAGRLTLIGNNTFINGLTLSEGTLNLDNNGALGAASSVFTITGGTIGNTSTTARTISNNNNQSWNGDFAFAGPWALNLGTGTVTLGATRTVSVITSSTGAFQNHTLTVAGPIRDGGNGYGLTKAGDGALVLSASNSYSGPTTVTGGTLTVSNTFALGSGAAALNINGGVLALSNSGTGIHVSRSGPITLAGGTISSGTFTNTGSALDARSGAISSVLAGTLGLTKTTSGTVALSGANTFSGGVALSAGQLNLNAAAALGTGTFTITGGVLGNSAGSSVSTTTANAHRWDSDFSFVGPSALTLGSGTVTLGATRTVTVTSSTLTVAIPITGADGLGLTKTGAGTLVLSGSNGYTGTTTVNDGVLTLETTNRYTGLTQVNGGRLNVIGPAGLYAGNTADWTAANITVGSGGILSVRTGTGNFTTANVTTLLTNLGGLGGAVNNNGLLAGSSIGFDTTLATGTVGNIIADSTGTGGGAIGLVKYGANTLLLTGSNTYSGTTSITAGTLQIGTTGRIAGPIDNAAALLISNTSVTLPGPITGTGSLTTSGTGVVTLSSASSVLGGPITIPGGRLESAGALSGAGAINLGSLALTGTFRSIGSVSSTTAHAVNLSGTSGGAVIDSSGSGALVFTSPFTANGNGNKTLTLTGSSTAGNSIVSVPNSTGTTSVTKTGPGTWRLTGQSAYTGRLTVLEGTIVAAANEVGGFTPFGTAGSAGTLPLIGDSAPNASGTVALLADGVTVTRGITVAASGSNGSQVVILGGTGASSAEFFSGRQITIGRSVTLQASTGGVVTFASTFIDSSGAARVTVGSPGNAGRVILSSLLPAFAGIDVVNGTAQLVSGSIGVNVIDPATPVTIGSSATLDISSATGISQQLGNLTFTGNSGSVTSGSGNGTLRLWSGSTATVTVTGPGNLISAPVALDVSSSFNVNSGGRLLVSSAISGSSGQSLTKSGAGVLEFTGTSSYPGATSVEAGSLLVNGQLGNTAVTVQSGGLLGGSGTFGGSISVLSGGTLSPGNSPGLIEASSLSLAGTTLMEIDGLSPRGGVGGYDAVNVSGLLTYGGSMVIDFGSLITAALPNDTTFDLFAFGSGSSSGSFTSITTANDGSWYAGLTFASIGGGDKWTATKDSQTLEFTHSTGNLVIVPEPGAIALAAIGIAAAAWAARRRK